MKVHFLDVPEPNLKEGANLVANCGATISSAVFAMKFDFDLGEISEWNALRVCQDCMELEPNHRFIYGLVNGEESKHAVSE